MFFHRRLNFDAQGRIVRADRPNHIGINPHLCKQTHAPARMIVWVSLVVKIVKQPSHTPALHVLTQHFGVVPHRNFYRYTMPAQ